MIDVKCFYQETSLPAVRGKDRNALRIHTNSGGFLRLPLPAGSSFSG